MKDLTIEPARLEEAFMEFYADADADEPGDPGEATSPGGGAAAPRADVGPG